MVLGPYKREVLELLDFLALRWDRLLLPGDIAKSFRTSSGKKISERTIRRWFDFLSAKYDFMYYPTFRVEEFGLKRVMVLYEGSKDPSIYTRIPYLSYIEVGVSGSLKKAGSAWYFVPSKKIREFENALACLRDKENDRAGEQRVFKMGSPVALTGTVPEWFSEKGPVEDLKNVSGCERFLDLVHRSLEKDLKEHARDPPDTDRRSEENEENNGCVDIGVDGPRHPFLKRNPLFLGMVILMYRSIPKNRNTLLREFTRDPSWAEYISTLPRRNGFFKQIKKAYEMMQDRSVFDTFFIQTRAGISHLTREFSLSSFIISVKTPSEYLETVAKISKHTYYLVVTPPAVFPGMAHIFAATNRPGMEKIREYIVQLVEDQDRNGIVLFFVEKPHLRLMDLAGFYKNPLELYNPLKKEWQWKERTA